MVCKDLNEKLADIPTMLPLEGVEEVKEETWI